MVEEVNATQQEINEAEATGRCPRCGNRLEVEGDIYPPYGLIAAWCPNEKCGWAS